jgi:chemotaxis protein MotB
MSDEDTRELIIIRKRHHAEDDDHHGGVWKLAFADFMTAMMAFFLVMWLINSTTKETKATIVQYFNPVQLVDANPARKGLHDPKDAGQGKSVQRSSGEERLSPEHSSSKEKSDPLHEAALLYDPMATLDEIARSSRSVDSSEPVSTPEGHPPSFGDPFDRIDGGPTSKSQGKADRSKVPSKSSQPVPADELASMPRQADPPPANTVGSKPVSQQQRSSPSANEEKSRPESNVVASMRSEVERILKKEKSNLTNIPHVDVDESKEGLLINLTDDTNFSMFAIGSVEPKPQLVRILEQIGRVLARLPGELELRGHTDARSYKSATYDNWRLSSDRANMAFYMLVRGGLDEKRVAKISGYADRQLKTPKDPLAPNNRRIEILLRRVDH